ncbi:MAG TPA: PA2779 family protein [Burkholderiales bacterium]|jgi:hypothetical protein
MNVWAKTICRLLIALMVWMPYQIATAGMIGTDQVVASSPQADRTTVLNFLNRADVAGKLQTLGLDPSTAKDRVGAMTDQEVQSLAGRIEAMPAGASDAGVLLLIILVAAAVWWFWQR